MRPRVPVWAQPRGALGSALTSLRAAKRSEEQSRRELASESLHLSSCAKASVYFVQPRSCPHAQFASSDFRVNTFQPRFDLSGLFIVVARNPGGKEWALRRS